MINIRRLLGFQLVAAASLMLSITQGLAQQRAPGCRRRARADCRRLRSTRTAVPEADGAVPHHRGTGHHHRRRRQSAISIWCRATAARCATASASAVTASSGRASLNITRKAEWPDWTPPPEMIARQPYLPRFMAGGPGNPLGARALYLGATVYRIHGTNRPDTIGTAVSSGCFRLVNADVADLYERDPGGHQGHHPAEAGTVICDAPCSSSRSIFP